MTPAIANQDAPPRRALRPAHLALFVWVVMLVVIAMLAVMAALLEPVRDLARIVYPDEPRPPGDLSVGRLLVHNLPLVLAPLVLWTTKWHATPRARAAGDLVVGGVVAYSAIGIALGVAAWPEVLDNLPHLPLELGALALGAAAWAALSRGHPLAHGLAYAAGAALLVAVAAPIELAAAAVD